MIGSLILLSEASGMLSFLCCFVSLILFSYLIRLLTEYCEPGNGIKLTRAVAQRILCPGQNGTLMCKVNGDQIGWTVEGDSAVYPGMNPQNLPNSTAYFINETQNLTSFLIYKPYPGVSTVVNISCSNSNGSSCSKGYTVIGTGT